MLESERNERWLTLSEYFELAEACGNLIGPALTNLIVALTDDTGLGMARGIRRVSYFDDTELQPERAVVARRIVPNSLWQYFHGVPADPGGIATWLDDPDKPGAWAKLDCLAGSLSIYDWWPDEDIEFGELEYVSLLLDAEFAEKVARGELRDGAGDVARTFSDDERRAWIKRRGRSPGGVDQAFREFRRNPLNDGTPQDLFRIECKEIWGPMTGRPRKA